MQRILVVDDEHLIADTISLIFRKNGFEANAAYSTEEALASARQFPPDLLLCDLNLPQRDGLELIQSIRADMPALPVLVLTGAYTNLRRLRESSAALPRPLAILTKPCEPTELLRTAGDMLLSA